MAAPEKIIVVAMTGRRVIGDRGKIPWHLPEDLRLFRELTIGHTVVMGRETFVSIGRPLPGRRNLVVSTTLPPTAGVEVCRSFDEAVARAEELGARIFFIGGASIYAQALPIAERLVISWVEADCDGDTFFPPFDESAWEAKEVRGFASFTQVICLRKQAVER